MHGCRVRARKISSEIGMNCRPGALTGRLFQRRIRRGTESIALGRFEQKARERSGLPLWSLRFLLWICGSSFHGWADFFWSISHLSRLAFQSNGVAAIAVSL